MNWYRRVQQIEYKEEKKFTRYCRVDSLISRCIDHCFYLNEHSTTPPRSHPSSAYIKIFELFMISVYFSSAIIGKVYGSIHGVLNHT